MAIDFDLDLFRLLIALVDGGSYASAARALGVSRATVRRRLALLEEAVGVSLIRRDGDLLTPTAVGAGLLRGARSLIAEATVLVEQAGRAQSEPSGLVRVALPPGEPPFLAAMAFKAMRRRWPRVRLALIDAAQPQDLLTTHADLALVLTMALPEGPWMGIDLLDLQCGLYASAGYLRRHPAPTCLAALGEHDLLYWEPPEGGPAALTARCGRRIPLSREPGFRSNNIHTLRNMTMAGAGIAWFPDGGFPAPGEAPGALQRVLPAEVGGVRPLRLLMPNAYRDVPRARALADALTELISKLRGPRG